MIGDKNKHDVSIDFPTGTLDSVFYTESSVDFYECNFFERCSFSFQPSHTDS